MLCLKSIRMDADDAFLLVEWTEIFPREQFHHSLDVQSSNTSGEADFSQHRYYALQAVSASKWF